MDSPSPRRRPRPPEKPWTPPESPLRNRDGVLDLQAVIALRKQGLTLQQIGDLSGCTRERIRQLLHRAGLDPKIGIAVRQAAVSRAKYQASWDQMPIAAQEFIAACQRDKLPYVLGQGLRPILRVAGCRVRVHVVRIWEAEGRKYLGVAATDPTIVHLCRLPGNSGRWFRVPAGTRAHSVPMEPTRGRWVGLTYVDLTEPGSVKRLLGVEEGQHGEVAERSDDGQVQNG